jgi:hypothetical protein
VERPEAPTESYLATVNGQRVQELCVQLLTHRPAHLMTTKSGAPASYELESTVRYMKGLPTSPIRPTRVGPYAITRIDITGDRVLVTTAGGCISLPLAMVTYSYLPE